MNALTQTVARFVLGALAALAFLLAPTALLAHDTGTQSPQAECYNGVVPLNPYVQSCTLPSNGPQIRGAAPDANAIIACRHHPGCLSWYVNGP
jgi:hypothetical protein